MLDVTLIIKEDLKEKLGLLTSPSSLSNFYRGKYETMACGIFSIEINS